MLFLGELLDLIDFFFSVGKMRDFVVGGVVSMVDNWTDNWTVGFEIRYKCTRLSLHPCSI
jgi:hypothetical protein